MVVVLLKAPAPILFGAMQSGRIREGHWDPSHERRRHRHRHEHLVLHHHRRVLCHRAHLPRRHLLPRHHRTRRFTAFAIQLPLPLLVVTLELLGRDVHRVGTGAALCLPHHAVTPAARCCAATRSKREIWIAASTTPWRMYAGNVTFLHLMLQDRPRLPRRRAPYGLNLRWAFSVILPVILPSPSTQLPFLIPPRPHIVLDLLLDQWASFAATAVL